MNTAFNEYQQPALADTDERQTITVLVVDSDSHSVDYIDKILSPDYTVLHAGSAEQAQPILDDTEIAILICGEYLPGENGLLFMARISQALPRTQPVLMSEGVTEDLLAFAINDVGVLKYLKKPLRDSILIDAVSGAREHYLKALENDRLEHNYKVIVDETQSLPYLARRFRQATPVILGNIGTSATAATGTLILMFLMITVLSLTVTVGIYLFKSALGIDVFSDIHFSDLLN